MTLADALGKLGEVSDVALKGSNGDLLHSSSIRVGGGCEIDQHGRAVGRGDNDGTLGAENFKRAIVLGIRLQHRRGKPL